MPLNVFAFPISFNVYDTHLELNYIIVYTVLPRRTRRSFIILLIKLNIHQHEFLQSHNCCEMDLIDTLVVALNVTNPFIKPVNWIKHPKQPPNTSMMTKTIVNRPNSPFHSAVTYSFNLEINFLFCSRTNYRFRNSNSSDFYKFIRNQRITDVLFILVRS